MKRYYVFPLVVLASVLLVGLQPALAKKPPQEPPPPEPTATHQLVSLGEGVNGGGLLNNNGVVIAFVADEIYAIVPVDTDGDGAPDTWYVDDDEDGINDLYHLVDPQTGPVTWLNGNGINDWGTMAGTIQVAGQSEWFPGYLEPVDTDADGAADLWYKDDDADGINDLITLLDGTVPRSSSGAMDVNNSGVITGKAQVNDTLEAVVWSNGTMQRLGYVGEGIAINDYGEVAGGTTGEFVFFIQPLDTDANGEPDTWFVDAGDGTNALATEAEGTWAYDINDNGLAVGVNWDGGDAYMWQLDAYGNVTTTFVGSYPVRGTYLTVATTVNASGVAVGQASINYRNKGVPSTRIEGFLIENDAIIPLRDRLSNPELLGEPGECPTGFNDAGVIAVDGANGTFLAIPITAP